VNDINWLVVIGIVVVGAAAIFLLGGEEPVPITQVPVLAPIADAGPDRVVAECGSVRVGCNGFDPAGGTVSFQWTAEAGSFDNSHSLHPLYTAPSTCGVEDIALTLTVTSEQSVVAQDSLIVHVSDGIPCSRGVVCPATPRCSVLPQPPVCSPVVAACPPQVQAPVILISAPRVEARSCHNPCPIPCRECAKPTFFTCAVECATDEVVEGGLIQLRGAVWDIDRNLANYYWTASAGSFDDASSINPVYCAPLTCNPCGEDVRIVLHAVDTCGASTESQIILHIRDLN
jgi:hypothetical protein